MADIEDDLVSLRTNALSAEAQKESATQVRTSYISKAFENYYAMQYKEAMVLLRKITLDDMESIGIFVNCAYDFWRSVNTAAALQPNLMGTSRLLIDDSLEPDQVVVIDNSAELAAIQAEKDRKALMKARSGKRVYTNLRQNISKEQLMMYETHKTVKTALDMRNTGFSTLDKDDVNSTIGMLSMTGSMSIFDKSDDQEEALEAAKKAFTQLLGGSNRKLIQPFDYVRLSHIYISEGALSGALQVCQLGQARGHLENTLIVIQMWSLLSRLDKKRHDAELCMHYLISAIQLEPRDNIDNDVDNKSPVAGPCTFMIMVQNSDLPLGYMYLFCASYLHRKYLSMFSIDTKNANKMTNGSIEKELCFNLLAEAYTVLNGEHIRSNTQLMEWFMNYEMFFDMAVYLENSAFPLLAEEALYEAFLRAPLLDLPLEFLLSLMCKHKRGAKRYVFEVMEKAYQHNPWNIFMRFWLVDYEAHESQKSKAYNNKYQRKFIEETAYAALIQGAMRGYILRVKKWPAIYYAAKKKRDAFNGKVSVANGAFILQGKALLKDRIRRWREYSLYLKELRWKSSILIQTQARRMNALNLFRKKYKRAMRANSLFLTMSQKYYDLQRTRYLRNMEQTYRAIILERSATTIVETLITNGYSKVFHAAMAHILKIIRVKRKWSCRKSFYEIKVRYYVRVKRHARATIRFWLRDTIERQREKKRKEALEKRLAAVEYLTAKSTAYIMPLKGLMWSMWRQVLHEKRCVQARAKIRQWLPRCCARVKARSIVRLKRIKLEIHRAFEQQCLFKRIGNYLLFWCRDAHVRPIQRFMRCYIARKRLKRMRRIMKVVNAIFTEKQTAIKRKHLWRCRKFLFLVKREYHQAARKITLAFKRWLKWKHIKRASLRKPAAYNLMWKMHCLILGRAFKKMSAGVTGLHTLLVLGPVFLSRWRQVVRIGFWRWRRYMIQQHRMDGLIEANTNRLEKHFWKGCGDAMVINRKKTYFGDENGSKGMVKTGYTMSWEIPVPVHRPMKVINEHSVQLLFQNTETRIKIKAFKTFIASYRYRKRIVRNGAIGAGMLARDLVVPLKLYLFMRQRSVRNIQCAWRQHVAIKLAYKFRTRAVRRAELYLSFKSIPKHKIFTWLYDRSKLQFEARWIIQCFFRRMLALRKFRRRARYTEWLEEQVEEIRLNSKSRRAVVAKVWHKMQIFYLYSMCGIQEGGMNTSIISLLNRLDRNKINLNNNNTPPVPGDDYNTSNASNASVGTSKQSGFTRAPLSSSSIANTKFTKKPKDLRQQVIKASSMGMTMTNNTSNSKIMRKAKPDGAKFARGNVKYGYSRTEEYKDAHNLGEEDEDMEMNENRGGKISGQDMQLSLSLHRLQQTGVFIFDCKDSSQAIVGKDLYFILQSAGIVFCQNVNSQALVPVYDHFHGSKLVMCGGGFSFFDAIYFCHFLARRRDAISVHFSDVIGMSFHAALCLTMCLGEPSDAVAEVLGSLCRENRVPMPGLNTLALLKEMSVDTSSLGVMGLAVLIANMSKNISLEILIIKFSNKNAVLPAVHAKAFRLLESNNTLRELRIFGCVLGPAEVQGLYDAIKGGLRGLVLLEFSASPEAQVISDAIIRLAKDRLYAGRGSLSVSVI